MIISAAGLIYWFFHSRLTTKEVVDTIFAVEPSKDTAKGKKLVQKKCKSSKLIKVHMGGSEMPASQGTIMNISQSPQEESQQPSEPLSITKSALLLAKPPPEEEAVEFDYDTANEIIDDTLDVVKLVQRINTLETFVSFLMNDQHDGRIHRNTRESSLLQVAAYVLRSDPAQPEGDMIEMTPTVPNTGGILDLPKDANAKELSSNLGQEYRLYLRGLVRKRGLKENPVKQEPQSNNSSP